MPVILDSLVKTIVADDQTEVDDKLHDLMAAWEITNSEVTELEITPFGACKFLITLLFSGPFVKRISIGLSAIRGNIQIIKAPKKPLLGLALIINKDISRGFSTAAGLLSAAIGRALAIGRGLSTTFGVLAATPSYSYHDTHQAYTYSPTSGLVSSIDRDIEIARAAGAPGLGLVLDISISWYRP